VTAATSLKLSPAIPVSLSGAKPDEQKITNTPLVPAATSTTLSTVTSANRLAFSAAATDDKQTTDGCTSQVARDQEFKEVNVAPSGHVTHAPQVSGDEVTATPILPKNKSGRPTRASATPRSFPTFAASTPITHDVRKKRQNSTPPIETDGVQGPKGFSIIKLFFLRYWRRDKMGDICMGKCGLNMRNNAC